MAPVTYKPVNWYDLTGYYDIVHREDTAREARFLQGVYDRYVESGGRRVLEPACGSGRLVQALARRGFTVDGFDSNRRMLRAAARKTRKFGRRVRLYPGELDDFSIGGRYDMAFCLISSFRHLLSDWAARRHLELVRRALKPGGVYVLGLHLNEYGGDHLWRERWTGKRGATEVVCNLQSWPPDIKTRLERNRLRVIVTLKGRTERFEHHFILRSYSTRQLVRLLKDVPGLEHVATYDFSADLGKPRSLSDDQLDFILVLKKPLESSQAGKPENLSR